LYRTTALNGTVAQCTVMLFKIADVVSHIVACCALLLLAMPTTTFCTKKVADWCRD